MITAQLDSKIIAQLSEQMEVVHTGWGVTEEVLSTEALIAELQDAEILVTELEVCSAEVIQRCPKLVFIGCCRNNPINIDVEAATQRRIPVVYAPGRNAQSVAEFALALMIMSARQMGRALRDVWQRKWTPEARFSYLEYKGYELQGKTVGIVGLGAIGRRVKRLCEAFDMQAVVCDPCLEQAAPTDVDVVFLNLPDLLRQADFVTLHVPDTPETVGLIGARELALMKPTAYLINTARGGHVVQESLVDALKRKQIAGAALDVFYQEPLPPDHMFYTLDNLIIMPHIGGATYEVIANHSRIMYEQIYHFLRGEPMEYLRNPEVFTSDAETEDA